MKRLMWIAAVALVAIPAAAIAQNAGGATGGMVGGAAAGAVIGGPIGAVVGGAAGAIVGSSLPPQPSVVYQGEVVVNQPVPETVTVYPIADNRDYDYAVINNERVIVDPRTHMVVRVIR
jgi:hypothetical protein